MAKKLALFGGDPIISSPLPAYNTIDDLEKKAVLEVLDSGVLSDFYGSHSSRFLGGPKVKELEQRWAEYFHVRFAVSVNSATSGLHAAVLAAGVGPGDEVIVPPFTMSATATSVLMANGIPVFADIDDSNYCINIDSVKRVHSERTKAIIVTNLFGGPADLDPLVIFCRENNLVLIEDNAQAPGGRYKDQLSGTIGNMGVFSLNCHKVIQCGEGGVIVTMDEDLATRLRLIRNHGEIVVEDMGIDNIVNMIGHNYRLTELQASIAMVQLEKLEKLTVPRIEMANKITQGLESRNELVLPKLKPGDRHVYYVYPFRFLSDQAGFSRNWFIKALVAEGFPVANYVKPLYLYPMYQKRIVYGQSGCPIRCPLYKGEIFYEKGLCPVAERLWEKEFVYTDICRWPFGKREADLFIAGVLKVLYAKDELKKAENG